MAQENKGFKIHGIPVLNDNIIWVWETGEQAVVVDPAVSEPVKEFLNKKNLVLNAILQTHHHDDHIGGTKALIRHWPSASVIACKSDLDRIPFQSHSVSDNEEFTLLGYEIKVLEVPGHTMNHIVFYLSDVQNKNIDPVLFCGDTLFGGGCGRLFEGSAKEMYESLCRLNSFPSNTKVYCAHEYTESNLRWASNLHPEDLLIKERLKKVSKKRSNGLLTIPSSLQEERKTNLFLRANNVETFSKLRNHKDRWKG